MLANILLLGDRMREKKGICKIKDKQTADRMYEKKSMCSILSKTVDGLDRIAGYEKEKKELMSLRKMLENIDSYQEQGVRIPRGIVLYGEPGVGKTVMARSIAYGDIKLFELRAADCCADDTSEKICNIFEEAKQNTPCMILLDELDKIAGLSRHFFMESNDQVSKTLLQELDMIGEKEGIIVVATCNDIESIGSALLRPGRFDRVLNINLPNLSSRQKIIEKYLAKLNMDKDIPIDYFAKVTSGYTGAKLECLINELGIMALEDNSKRITKEHLRLSMNRQMFGESEAECWQTEEEKRAVAVHEAGHTIVAMTLIPDTFMSVSILPQGGAGGHTKFMFKGTGTMSKKDAENQIKIALAGRVAEREILHEIYLGSDSDIRMATDVCNSLLTTHACYGYEYAAANLVEYPGSMLSSEGRHSLELRIDDILTRIDSEVTDIILKNKDCFLEIADTLAKEQFLLVEDVQAIMDKYKKVDSYLEV